MAAEAATGSNEADADSRVAEAMARARKGIATPFGWAPVWAMVLVTLVDRVETSVVAGALPILQDEFGFSDAAGGAIPAAVGIAGLIMTLPAGLIADRVDRRRFIAVVVASWSFIITGSALATGFAFFFVTRVILGFADSLEGASAASLLSDWYPPKARARVYGYQRMATFAGGPIGALLGGVVGETLGWRWVFFLMVIPGLLVAWFVRRQPEPKRGQIDREVALLGDDVDDGMDDGAEVVVGGEPALAELTDLRSQLRRLMRIATVKRLYLGLLVLFFGAGGIAFWAPSFFERTHDLGEGAAAAIAAIVGLVGVGVGATVGGIWGDRWHGRFPGARVVIGGGGQCAGALIGPAAFLVDPLWAQAVLLTITMSLLALGIPNISAAIADVLPSQRRGVGFALLNFMVALGVAFGPLMVGALSDLYGSLDLALATLSAPVFIGALIVLRARSSYEADARAVLVEARRLAE